MKYEIINPTALGAPRGWNNGLLATAGGRLLFVAGQTARDASGQVPEASFVEQFGRALDNALMIVRAAGGDAASIGRMTIYVTSRDEYAQSLKPLGAAYRERMGRHYPAMTLVEVGALVDENAVVEIEVTAVVDGEGPAR